MSKNIIIIGAGPAGLTAAYELLTNTDYIPIVLEESDSVGGISKTINYHGNRMDIGGHRFFSKSKEVCDLWEKILPFQGTPEPDPAKVDNVMLRRNRVSHIYYSDKFFDYPLSIKPRTFINMGLAQTFRAGFGYIGATLHKRKEYSLEDFYINRFGKPLYSMFFEDYTEKIWGRHPSEISPDWGAQRVKGLSIAKALGNAIKTPFHAKKRSVETSLIEHFSYPKYGPGQLWETLAKLIVEKGGEIHFEEKVSRISMENEKIQSITALSPTGPRTYAGEYYLSSMAVKDFVQSMNHVPESILHIANGLPYRDFITVGVLVNKQHIAPDCWIYIQDRNVKLGRLQIFNNWSPYMVSDPNTVWIGLEYFCSEGDAMWNMSEEDFTRFAIHELEQIHIINAKDVLDSHQVKIKKAYPAYFDTYNSFDCLKKYLSNIKNLYCIGRNGQHRYNNMDHSMLTAMEAVRSIQEGKHDTSNVWNVNTEDEYHEEKE